MRLVSSAINANFFKSIDKIVPSTSDFINFVVVRQNNTPLAWDTRSYPNN